jgi:hypothetical protein
MEIEDVRRKYKDLDKKQLILVLNHLNTDRGKEVIRQSLTKQDITFSMIYNTNPEALDVYIHQEFEVLTDMIEEKS